jgi:linoleate 10R-lipoxygenase
MAKSLYRENWHNAVKEFYEYITIRLLHEKSYQIAGLNHVDITRE